MKTVFISYSSKDKEFSERLASDLKGYGLGVWFDQWEIKVGDSIIEKISQGIEQNNFLAIVLSSTSVQSNWVKKELNSALVSEIEKKSIIVLPILYEKCNIPILLQEKKYANFTENYERGLKELLSVLLPDDFNNDENLNKQLSVFYINKAIESEQNSNIKDAFQFYEIAKNYEPDFDDVYYNWGVLEVGLNNINSAISLFEKTIELNPKHKLALFNIGSLAYSQGNFKMSVDFLVKAINEGFENYNCYRLLGLSLKELGHYLASIKIILKAIIKVPSLEEYANCCLSLYDSYIRIEDTGYSIAYLEEGLNMYEKLRKYINIDFYISLIEGFLNAGMFEKASYYANRALDIYSNNNRILILLDIIKNRKEVWNNMGIKYFETAIKASYENCQINMLRGIGKRDFTYTHIEPKNGNLEINIRRIKGNEET
jgi:tetratricopeptide (TPR) repeat protein